jgi:hypothetical protein
MRPQKVCTPCSQPLAGTTAMSNLDSCSSKASALQYAQRQCQVCMPAMPWQACTQCSVRRSPVAGGRGLGMHVKATDL